MTATRITSNPTLSTMHAACLSREIAQAADEEALRAAARRRIPFLLGKDRDRMRDEYARRLAVLRKGICAE